MRILEVCGLVLILVEVISVVEGVKVDDVKVADAKVTGFLMTDDGIWGDNEEEGSGELEDVLAAGSFGESGFLGSMDDDGSSYEGSGSGDDDSSEEEKSIEHKTEEDSSDSSGTPGSGGGVDRPESSGSSGDSSGDDMFTMGNKSMSKDSMCKRLYDESKEKNRVCFEDFMERNKKVSPCEMYKLHLATCSYRMREEMCGKDVPKECLNFWGNLLNVFRVGGPSSKCWIPQKVFLCRSKSELGDTTDPFVKKDGYNYTADFPAIVGTEMIDEARRHLFEGTSEKKRFKLLAGTPFLPAGDDGNIAKSTFWLAAVAVIVNMQ